MPANQSVGPVDWYPPEHDLVSLNGINPPAAESTHRQYHTTLSSWGRKFADESSLGMTVAMTWANKQHDGTVVIDTRAIHRFISFVHDAVGEGEGDATTSNYNAVKKAIP